MIQLMDKLRNERLTQVGIASAGGAVMRQFWQPVALVEEFDPEINPAMKNRPLKAVRALGQDFVLFKQPSGVFSLLDKHCAHRGADLTFARYEIVQINHAPQAAVRCPFHGWQYAGDGGCLDTPAEPTGSTLCQRVKQPSYPTNVRSGVVFAWLGEGNPPPFPALDCYQATSTHSFAFKGLWQCNWLQAFEVGIDPAHPSFLHRYLQDVNLEDTGSNAAGKQFRSAAAGEVAGERWPMSRVMRELCQPKIDVLPTDYGMQLTAMRALNPEATDGKITHTRITHAVFPHTFIIPLSETMTITQIHLPIDDTHTYWYSIFTSTGEPLDHAAMREQRARHTNFPDYTPKSGRHNQWGFNADEQASRTYLGMGEDDINVHDQWAVESMGAIQDRTTENLGTSDIAIARYRRWLLNAMDQLEANPTSRLKEALAQVKLAVAPQTFDGFR
jgi:phthalate 4,5-dioxygenase